MEGKVKEYKIRITKIDKHTREENKGLEIEVTDPKLLEIQAESFRECREHQLSRMER